MNKFQELNSKTEKGLSGHNSINAVVEMIHINAFNTLPVFAIASLVLGEVPPVVKSGAIRGTISKLNFRLNHA